MSYISKGGELIQEFTEIESGRKKDRPELLEAISLCNLIGATLVIAKLDRLSRNASFTLSLVDSGIKFVAVDMPNANELTVGIMSIIAQDEAKRISERTTAALKMKSIRLAVTGKKLGTPANLTGTARINSIISRKESAKNNDNNRKALALVRAYKGLSLSKIAFLLNTNGFKTSGNCDFTATSVKRIKELYGER